MLACSTAQASVGLFIVFRKETLRHQESARNTSQLA